MQRRDVLKATGLSFLAGYPLMNGTPVSAAEPDNPEDNGRAQTPFPAELLPQFAKSARHTTSYLEAGPKMGPAVIFVHGWPETSLAWRHQIQALSLLGFRVIAPDLRGCGQSSLYATHAAYSQREIVRDMIELSDQLQVERATWVGHDWGAAVVWSVARHHPERCHGVAALCVPYDTLERGVGRLIASVDRHVYPESEFPAGQYEYAEFYHEHFDDARRAFEANLENTFKVIMRRGDASQAGKPFPTAFVRKQGGWFGPGRPAPDVPLDTSILSEADLAAYVRAYRRTGFFGIDSLYMNDADNDAYAREAPTDIIEMPTLFLSGGNDFVNDTEHSSLADAMRSNCHNLMWKTIASGHWMQHERPSEVSATLCQWIGDKVPAGWPT